MTLTLELDLDILPLDLHAKIHVRMSVRSAGIARQTDGQTHTQTNDVKTITAITSETWGVMKFHNDIVKVHLAFTHPLPLPSHCSPIGVHGAHLDQC